MKITLTFKTPDAVETALEHAMQFFIYQFLQDQGDEVPAELTAAQQEELDEKRQQQREHLTALLERWIQYGEVLTVEFDTEKGTCQVLPVTRSSS
jgi:hypothetical protein